MTINVGGQNWMTSVAGVLAGVGTAVLGAAATHLIMLNNTETIIFLALSAAGQAFMGLSAKDATTHDTAAQVAKATTDAATKP